MTIDPIRSKSYSPPIREEKQRRQRDGQLELSPIPDEIRNQSHTHVTQIERDVVQRADDGSPFAAHHFHSCNRSKTNKKKKTEHNNLTRPF